MKKNFYMFMIKVWTRKAFRYSSPAFPSEKCEYAFGRLEVYRKKLLECIDKKENM